MHKSFAFGRESFSHFPENINPDTIAGIGRLAIPPSDQFPHYFAVNESGGGTGGDETQQQKTDRLRREFERINREFEEVERVGKPRKKDNA